VTHEASNQVNTGVDIEACLLISSNGLNPLAPVKPNDQPRNNLCCGAVSLAAAHCYGV
jgi:hypothetical protein